MTIEIGDDIERKFEDYSTKLGGNKESYIEQAILEKLRMMEIDLYKLEIERQIEKGFKQIENGEGIPFEEAMAEVDAYLDELLSKENVGKE